MNSITKLEVIFGVLIPLLSGAVWVGFLTNQISVLERDSEDLKQQIMNPAAFIKVFETQLLNLKTKI